MVEQSRDRRCSTPGQFAHDSQSRVFQETRADTHGPTKQHKAFFPHKHHVRSDAFLGHLLKSRDQIVRGDGSQVGLNCRLGGKRPGPDEQNQHDDNESPP